MKNKQLNRILLPAVLLIWLAVIFRFDKEHTPADTPAKQALSWEVPPDSQLFIPPLNLTYRDPFLQSKWVKKSSSPSQNQLRIQLPTDEKPPTLLWKFKGTIQQQGEQLALVEVNGDLHYLKKDESYHRCACQQIEAEQLWLLCGEQKLALAIGRDTLL